MPIRHFDPSFTWERTPILQYKEDVGTHFKDITRQLLYEGSENIPCQLRYFEILSGGYSTLEMHEHIHVVMIMRGSGTMLLDEKIITIAAFDCIEIPSRSWHQLRATSPEPLGFLCVVSCVRDTPILPTQNDIAHLKTVVQVSSFLRV